MNGTTLHQTQMLCFGRDPIGVGVRNGSMPAAALPARRFDKKKTEKKNLLGLVILGGRYKI